MTYANWISDEGRRPLTAQFRLDASQRKLSISRSVVGRKLILGVGKPKIGVKVELGIESRGTYVRMCDRSQSFWRGRGQVDA